MEPVIKDESLAKYKVTIHYSDDFPTATEIVYAENSMHAIDTVKLELQILNLRSESIARIEAVPVR